MKLFIDAYKVDPAAMQQLYTLNKLNFIEDGDIAVMPDVHPGYGGIPIGTVIATKNMLLPSAGGGDIGCGVAFIETDLDCPDKETISKVLSVFEEKIKELPKTYNENLVSSQLDHNYIKNIQAKAREQIRTIGGGNHFAELQRNTRGKLCITIHSGSRKAGKMIEDKFCRRIRKNVTTWWGRYPYDIPVDFEPCQTELGKDYMHLMKWAIRYAEENRFALSRTMLSAVEAVISKTVNVVRYNDNVHNYITIENFNHRNYYIHRKGAVCARKGIKIVIPGSMGTKSYLVEGLGEESAWNSCSHGAGRLRSRSMSKKLLDLEEQKEIMKDVVFNLDESTIDEAPGAYKDIDEVIGYQKDKLIKVLDTLIPVGVIKNNSERD